MKSEHEFASRAAYEKYLREYYAGLAIISVSGNAKLMHDMAYAGKSAYQVAAEIAVRHADALIAELNK